MGAAIHLAYLGGEVVIIAILVCAMLWYVVDALISTTETTETTEPAQPSGRPQRPAGFSRVAPFDPVTDLRTASGLKGTKIYLPHVPGGEDGQCVHVTLNDDYLAVGRRNAEVQAILLDSSTVVRLNLGALPGYAKTRYHMALEHAGESVRLPVSFKGWLEIFDACRAAGGRVEVAAEISDQMRTIILGKEGARRRPAPDDVDARRPARPAKCPSCGASAPRRGTCDYCGVEV